ncbi:MAG: helix-turn-helix transcriptional regulator [Candidatus Nanohaloarchaeota archaeon QJJ-5]|nr:helix-turn-helix transcriptional regulator [Candidatus Nanohaloarchaeota archaeon QJJ-5]
MTAFDMPEWCEAEDWCPITVTAELLGRKWHPVIVHRLLQQPMGFSQLRKQVHDISDKVLSESLDDLCEKDIVKREVISESPKTVEYSLTDRGKSLAPVIEAMKDWGETHTGDF